MTEWCCSLQPQQLLGRRHKWLNLLRFCQGHMSLRYAKHLIVQRGVLSSAEQKAAAQALQISFIWDTLNWWPAAGNDLEQHWSTLNTQHIKLLWIFVHQGKWHDSIPRYSLAALESLEEYMEVSWQRNASPSWNSDEQPPMSVCLVKCNMSPPMTLFPKAPMYLGQQKHKTSEGAFLDYFHQHHYRQWPEYEY